MKLCRTVIVTLHLLCLLITGCGQPVNEEQGEEKWKGTITISGAWALYPLMISWADEFQKLYPDVRFDISAGGAGKGMTDALANAVDIGMVSREIYPEEINKGAFWIPVTKDAVFLTTNATNPVNEVLREKGVTREALIGIYITGEITTWGQVVGRTDLTDPIHIYTRSDAAGAPATWAAYLGGAQEDLLGIGVYGDPGLLEAVINDPLGIGYNNLNYAFDFSTGKPVMGAFVIPIDINGNGRVDPEETFDTKEQAISAVANGLYPSPPARELNLVTNGKPTGLTQLFIQWVLTDGQQYVEEAGYIPLAVERIEEGLNKLK
ncbi:MAG TPA: phosphate ABC transporter substrate-binding protein [Anaerolineae bacterium]|nr:phosphate ABC transporter substrate-binding protein [Anaerolineae bacterium]